MGQDKGITVSESALERLIEGNQKASELHREASNKAYYNQAVSHSIDVLQDMVARLKEGSPKENLAGVMLLDAAITLLVNLKK